MHLDITNIISDVCDTIDSGCVTLQTLLDVSATFDMANHDILIPGPGSRVFVWNRWTTSGLTFFLLEREDDDGDQIGSDYTAWTKNSISCSTEFSTLAVPVHLINGRSYSTHDYSGSAGSDSTLVTCNCTLHVIHLTQLIACLLHRPF